MTTNTVESHTKNLTSYIVLYRDESVMCPADAPFGFQCWAEDGDHAEEQCLNADPDAVVVWIFEGSDYDKALDDYYDLNSDADIEE